MSLNYALIFSVFVSFLTVISCKKDGAGNTENAAQAMETYAAEKTPTFAVTLNGKPLQAMPEPDTIKQNYIKSLDEARAFYLGNLKNVKGYADYGRKALNLGYVENALQVLSKGIDQFPNTADLYYYRGMASVIGRQFPEAVSDFWKAGKAIEGQRDAKGILDKTEEEKKIDATLQYEVYKWMGLAFQCQGDFTNAEKMYEVCGDFSTNSDLYCISYYWQYQAYMRAGREKDATSLLGSVSPKMYISASTQPYLDALLYFKGEKSETDLVNLNEVPKSSIEANGWSIKAYAIAVKALLEKKETRFVEVLDKIVASPFWNQAAFIAAEADHHRLKGFNYEKMKEVKMESDGKRKG
ncbi:MAG: hypothetical protein IPM92_02220 [Saprospiraceae bacterium]|nr:hypothetical protein [Saprospiraceae bacterium]